MGAIFKEVPTVRLKISSPAVLDAGKLKNAAAWLPSLTISEYNCWYPLQQTSRYLALKENTLLTGTSRWAKEGRGGECK